MVLMPQGLFTAKPGPVVDNSWLQVPSFDTTGLVGEGESNPGGLLSIAAIRRNFLDQSSQSAYGVTSRGDVPIRREH